VPPEAPCRACERSRSPARKHHGSRLNQLMLSILGAPIAWLRPTPKRGRPRGVGIRTRPTAAATDGAKVNVDGTSGANEVNHAEVPKPPNVHVKRLGVLDHMDYSMMLAVAFSPSSRYLVTGGQGKVMLWNTENMANPTLVRALPTEVKHSMTHVAVLAAETLTLPSSAPCARRLQAPGHLVRSCAMSDDDRYIVAGGEWRGLVVWDRMTVRPSSQEGSQGAMKRRM